MNKKKLEEKKKQYDFEERMKELKEDVSDHQFLLRSCFFSAIDRNVFEMTGKN